MTMAQPLQPRAQPSRSNGSETGKDTGSGFALTQGTHKHHSTFLGKQLRGNTSLGAIAIPTLESVFFILVTHLPFLLYMC